MRGRSSGASVSALHLRYVADPRELSAIRGAVAAWAERARLPTEALVDLLLAVGEAAANGVEHAYRNRPRGDIEIDLALCSAGSADPRSVVAVRVADHGHWRPWPVGPSYRGRGLALIRQLALHVELRATGGGTEARFEIPLPI